MCSAVAGLLSEEVEMEENDFVYLEEKSRAFIKKLDMAPEVAMLIKSLLQRPSWETGYELHQGTLEAEFKVRPEEAKRALKTAYDQVWRRLELLFEEMQKYYQVSEEYERLVSASKKLLQEKLLPLF